MLTKRDINEIEKLIDQKLDEKLKYLPSKGEFYDRMDKLSGEIQKYYQEVTIITGYKDQIESHESRIDIIEDALGISPAIE